MEIPQETEDYIRESFDHSLGLTVSTNTLLLKIQALEADRVLLSRQNLCLRSQLKEKDEAIVCQKRKDEQIERARAEATMNALALKKFVEENKKLAMECSNLLENSKKWERECSLYERDREALMDFANEADEKAKEMEEENVKLREEMNLYKSKLEAGQLVDVPTDDQHMEQVLLDSLLSTVVTKDDPMSNAHGFLETHRGVEVCQKLLNIWSSLRPLSWKVVALVAEVKKLENDKDHLAMNLDRAETEVNVLFEENSMNKKLIRKLFQEKHVIGSSGKHDSSASGKGKRKCSPTPKMCSPVEKKLDFGDVETERVPLSPVPYNSPEPGSCKK